MYDFELAKDKVLMGAERKSHGHLRRREASHCLSRGRARAGRLKVPNADPVHKVTIIPRGMALGVTMQLPIDDKHNYTKEYLRDRDCDPDGRTHRGGDYSSIR